MNQRAFAFCVKPAQRQAISQGCPGELAINLLGRDSGVIGSWVEAIEARINRK